MHRADEPVRVGKQPPNQLVYLEGMQGYIEEIGPIDATLGQLYAVRGLTEKGKSLGIGWVPEKFLTIDGSPASLKVRNKYQAEREIA